MSGLDLGNIIYQLVECPDADLNKTAELFVVPDGYVARMRMIRYAAGVTFAVGIPTECASVFYEFDNGVNYMVIPSPASQILPAVTTTTAETLFLGQGDVQYSVTPRTEVSLQFVCGSLPDVWLMPGMVVRVSSPPGDTGFAATGIAGLVELMEAANASPVQAGGAAVSFQGAEAWLLHQG